MPQKTRKRQGGVRAPHSMRMSGLKSLGKSLKRHSLSRLAHNIKHPHLNNTVKSKSLRSVYMGSMKQMKKHERQAAREAHKAHMAQQALKKEMDRMARIARGDNSNSNNNNNSRKSVKSQKRNVSLNYITRLMSTGKSFVGLVDKKEKPKATRKRANKMDE